jgi:hypothetical protein
MQWKLVVCVVAESLSLSDMPKEAWYCPLPFKHVYVDNTGVAACCQTPRYNMSIDQWINSDILATLQSTILEGKIPQVCHGCVRQENIQKNSLRLSSLHDYAHEKFVTTDIDFIDYRGSNICNFKCRSCSPTFSHGIANETKRHDSLKRWFVTKADKIYSVTEDNVDWIYQNLSKINRLMLTGGEPTYIPQVKYLLEKIVYDNYDLDVLITTNASFTDNFWFELTRKFKRLHWTISLDAVGPAAEIIRHGTDWSTIENNIVWLSTHAHSLNFNTVVSNLNVLHLKPLLKFVNQMKKNSVWPKGLHGDKGCRHQFHVCQRPYFLAADNLPPDIALQALDHLQQCLTLTLDTEQSQMISGLINAIENMRYDATLWKQSEDYNLTLDQIRFENHKNLYVKEIL